MRVCMVREAPHGPQPTPERLAAASRETVSGSQWGLPEGETCTRSTPSSFYRSVPEDVVSLVTTGTAYVCGMLTFTHSSQARQWGGPTK